MKRFNLVFTDDEVSELERAKELLGAVSFTETIRRSVRLTNKLLELQGNNGQLIIKDKKSIQSTIIVA